MDEKTLRKIIHEELGKLNKATLTIKECAEYSGLGETKIREHIHSEKSDFPFFRNGVKFGVNKELLDIWLKKVATEHKTI